MNEIDLKYVAWRHEDSPRTYNLNPRRLVPNLDMEDLYAAIFEKVKNGEKVYVRFSDSHIKRPGAIALINRITGDGFQTRSYQNSYDKDQTIFEDKESQYIFHLKWDDRNNAAKIVLNGHNLREGELFYLPDYTGSTVWSMFDAKKYAKDHAKPVYDRLNNKLSVNDAVVYINARYGTGAYIELGVVREIIYKASKNYHGKTSVASTVVVESIALNDREEPEISNINKSHQSILKMTDVDLFDEAFVRKLTIPQNQRK